MSFREDIEGGLLGDFIIQGAAFKFKGRIDKSHWHLLENEDRPLRRWRREVTS